MIVVIDRVGLTLLLLFLLGFIAVAVSTGVLLVGYRGPQLSDHLVHYNVDVLALDAQAGCPIHFIFVYVGIYEYFRKVINLGQELLREEVLMRFLQLLVETP